LSALQLWTLLTAAVRELRWGLPAVACELCGWRRRASSVPDRGIRTSALGALCHKRGNTDGAALFWTISGERNMGLICLLVAYQAMWDFLDTVSEQGASSGQRNGRALHRALIDAIDPPRARSDYYRHHGERDDGGYLRALVGACRARCGHLPSHGCVRALLAREALRANVQAVNHDLDPARREASLRAWVAREFPGVHEPEWFELSAAAGAGLSIYALLVLAAGSSCDEAAIAHFYRAYFPWASALATMLDSHVDQPDDVANGDHVYVTYYGAPAAVRGGIERLIRRSLAEARALPDGERHVLVVAAMIAMYLSKDSARRGTASETTRALVSGAGSLTRLLLPVLRLWRILYGQRAT
jgi:tetraprenyl-beta-curcumene synthase